MLTHQQARQIAENEVNEMKVVGQAGELVIVDALTLEKPYAWIFFYSSKRHIETGDMLYALAGNAPLFISKLDGHISTFPTGLSIDGMIDEYEEKHQIWKLVLADNVYSDVKKLLDLKQLLDLSSADIAEYKKVNEKIIETGSKTRLLKLQMTLADKNIHTQILQSDLF